MGGKREREAQAGVAPAGEEPAPKKNAGGVAADGGAADMAMPEAAAGDLPARTILAQADAGGAGGLPPHQVKRDYACLHEIYHIKIPPDGRNRPPPCRLRSRDRPWPGASLNWQRVRAKWAPPPRPPSVSQPGRRQRHACPASLLLGPGRAGGAAAQAKGTLQGAAPEVAQGISLLAGGVSDLGAGVGGIAQGVAEIAQGAVHSVAGTAAVAGRAAKTAGRLAALLAPVMMCTAACCAQQGTGYWIVTALQA